MQQEHNYSMPGMVYTPVEIGTIRLGHLEDRNGRPTPVKDDKFTITRLVRRRAGWLAHPLQNQLLAKLPPPAPEEGAAERKLREIPIRIMYDSPDLTVRSRYEAFDAERKRPVCASTSAGKARRLTADAAQDVECLGPDACTFAKGENIRCKFFGRIMVQIDGQNEADNGFVLRSTSINTLRNFEAKLTRYWALFGKRLTGVPFRLILRTKTTTSSFWRPFYFCDLELSQGLTLRSAAKLARDHAQANEDAGLDIQAWEGVVRTGLSNGALAAASDIEADLMTEFYADGDQSEDGAGSDDESEPKKNRQTAPALVPIAGLAGAQARQETPTLPGQASIPTDISGHSVDQSTAPSATLPAERTGCLPAPVQPQIRQAGAERANAEDVAAGGTARPQLAPLPAAEKSRHLPPKAPPLSVSQRPPVRQNPAGLAQRRPTPTHR